LKQIDVPTFLARNESICDNPLAFTRTIERVDAGRILNWLANQINFKKTN